MIFVCVKPIPDVNNLSVSTSQNRVFEKAKRLLNPQDERAIEMACQMGETVAVVIGTDEETDVVRGALARGAARGILVAHPEGRGFDAVVLTRVIAALAEREKAEKIVCGNGWPSDALGQVGYRLMEQTSIPVVVVSPTGQPKLPSAMSIMKAMKKEIRKVNPEELGVDLKPVAVVKELRLP